MKHKLLLILLPVALLLGAFIFIIIFLANSSESSTKTRDVKVIEQTNSGSEQPQVANPASVFCEEQGGKIEIVNDSAGSKGLCRFDNGNFCDEWLLYKNKCFKAAPILGIDREATYSAVMKTTAGELVIKLLPDTAPIAVNNFVFLSKHGFYNDVIFHRIIENFMVQTGDPEGTGRGGPGYSFNDEKPIIRSYLRGTVAMANAGPNTNGSQFFIMTQDNNTMPKDYVIFGELSDGYSVLDKIAKTPVTASITGEKSKPINPPAIISVTILKNGLPI